MDPPIRSPYPSTSPPHNLPKYPMIKTSTLLLDHKCGQCQSIANIQTSPLQVERQSAKHQPSLWSYDFVQSLNNDYAVTMHMSLFPFIPPPLISLSKVENVCLTTKRQYLKKNKMKKNHQLRTLYISIYLKL
jgi:hypothetical protein